ncbi:unnamed protein product [Paramecium primaurelia]|uniref:Uncharacterized protein n=1 Tax=Paramecium primaurelia TaxID=5886 RepID=A0A8S1LZU5_PARPR|nr:unnamed protein product [Paramecium primaurelia]
MMMNSSTDSPQIMQDLDSKPQNQQLQPLCDTIISTQEFESIVWDETYTYPKRIKTKFQIKVTKGGIKYTTIDGSIHRIDDFTNIQENPQFWVNMEQIKYCQWQGEYQENIKKIGKWTMTWNGNLLKDVGGQYSDSGQKIGQWKEIIKNYQNSAQAYEIGSYSNNVKTGIWKVIYNDKEIGEGSYNEFGVKNGKWIQLNDTFWKYQSQVTLHGEYKNGTKVGQWDIYYQEVGNSIQIGGGVYDQQGDGLRNGQWIQLSENFHKWNQITYNGRYQCDKKVGKWDIYYGLEQMYINIINKILLNIRGGGQYDEQGCELKIGKWIELSENFRLNSQAIYEGEYCNGNKVGKWNIYFRFKGNKLIGGGSYDNEGLHKIGRWIELSDCYEQDRQVTYHGEYRNGKKVGRWDIYFDKINKQYLIGGGSYDEDGLYKIGMWVEWSEHDGHIIYNGEYRNGKKVGRWDIYFFNINKNYLIGGGLYDEEGLYKIGRWIEVSNGFEVDRQVTYNGEYRNGKKVGRWDIYFKFVENKQIGGGLYDEEGEIKVGRWIELSDNFHQGEQLIYEGFYKRSKKEGTWVQKNIQQIQPACLLNNRK